MAEEKNVFAVEVMRPRKLASGKKNPEFKSTSKLMGDSMNGLIRTIKSLNALQHKFSKPSLQHIKADGKAKAKTVMIMPVADKDGELVDGVSKDDLKSGKFVDRSVLKKITDSYVSRLRNWSKYERMVRSLRKTPSKRVVQVDDQLADIISGHLASYADGLGMELGSYAEQFGEHRFIPAHMLSSVLYSYINSVSEHPYVDNEGVKSPNGYKKSDFRGVNEEDFKDGCLLHTFRGFNSKKQKTLIDMFESIGGKTLRKYTHAGMTWLSVNTSLQGLAHKHSKKAVVDEPKDSESEVQIEQDLLDEMMELIDVHTQAKEAKKASSRSAASPRQSKDVKKEALAFLERLYVQGQSKAK